MHGNTAPGPDRNVPPAPTDALYDAVLFSDTESLRNEHQQARDALETEFLRLSGLEHGDVWRAYDIPSGWGVVRTIAAVGRYSEQPDESRMFRAIFNSYGNNIIDGSEVVRVWDYIYDITSGQLTIQFTKDTCYPGEEFEGEELGPLVDYMLRQSPEDEFLACTGLDYEDHLPVALYGLPIRKARLFTKNIHDMLSAEIVQKYHHTIMEDHYESLALRSLASTLSAVRNDDRIQNI